MAELGFRRVPPWERGGAAEAEANGSGGWMGFWRWPVGAQHVATCASGGSSNPLDLESTAKSLRERAREISECSKCFIGQKN